MKSYKVLGILLTYPQRQWLEHGQQLIEILAEEAVLPPASVALVEAFVSGVQRMPLLDAQERYCETFDRSRNHCLNLFEHVHGESRDRGQAMVELLLLYEAIGLQSKSEELPDYLPLYLEYLSQLPLEDARRCLADCADVIAVIAERLLRRQSPYAAILQALVQLSGKSIDYAEVEKAAANSPDEDSPAAIDAAWEEAAAFDGEPSTPCPAMVGGSPDASRVRPIEFVTPPGATPA